jgi:fibronectin-binding autotransporter adhesin
MKDIATYLGGLIKAHASQTTKRGGLWSYAFVVGMLAGQAVGQTTYTWTQMTTGAKDWTVGANWTNGTVFVSGSANELKFFADTTTTGPAGIQTITNVATSLSLNTLTLNGKGPNDTAGFTVIVGDNTSTWTIGDGTTSTITLNAAAGGGGAADADGFTIADRYLNYTIAPNLTLNTNTTFTGAGGGIQGVIFTGNITDGGVGRSLTKIGSHLLVLSGTNTYSGVTTVSQGTLRLGNASALPGGIGVSGGISALTLNAGMLELPGGEFRRNLGTGSDQFQITGGSSGLGTKGAPLLVVINNNAEIAWGTASFNPSTLVLNTTYSDNTLFLANDINLNSATPRTVQVSRNAAILSGDIRNSSGAGGLTKSGNGTLVLTGNNTYTGNTTNNAGTISVSTASNLGSGSSSLIMNGGGLQITGTALTNISGLGHAVTFNNNAKAFDIQDASHTFIVDQPLIGTTLIKSGAGTLVLNQTNTLTGATTVSGGGTLVLDYSTNNVSKLANAALTFTGSALVLKGGSHTQLVSATSITAYYNGSISRDGGSAKISLGAITLPTVSSLSIAETNLATTTTGNGNGILAQGRVTVGSHFGCNDGSGNIVAFNAYTNATTAGVGNTAWVTQLTGGGTMGATLSSYSLRITNSGNSDVLNLGANSLSLINNGTFLYAGGFDNNYTINGSGAISSASGNQPFLITIYAGCTLTLNARSSSNYAPVSKSGQGTLVLGGNNSTVSTIYVQEGVLRLTNKDGLGGTSGGTIVRGGAVLELANNITVGAEALTLSGFGISNGGALRNISGTNTYGGAITIVEGGVRINSDSGKLVLTGGIGTTDGQNLARGIQLLAFGGAGDIIVSTNGIRGAANLIKDGSGTFELVVADNVVQSSCGDMTLNASTFQLTFNVAPSPTVAPVRILGDLTFNGTPTIKISVNPALFTKGVAYPLLTVSGSKPETEPNVQLVGVTGTLKWVGNTLLLAPSPQGSIISFN